jgi:uncharacterized protein YbcI
MEDGQVLQSAGAEESDNSVLAAISRAMVRLYKEQFGRGPTKARTEYAGDDTLICTLENTLTRAELKLVELGEDQRLRDIRMFFQHATEDEFRAVVEGLTGRTVRAFISGTDTGEDVSCEIFYLVPRLNGVAGN